jgi:hypothetical protein
VIKPDAINQGQKDGKTVDQVLEAGWKFGPEGAAVGIVGTVGYPLVI